MDETTTIKLTKATKKRLESRGKMGDSYEDVIVRMLDRLDELERAKG